MMEKQGQASTPDKKGRHGELSSSILALLRETVTFEEALGDVLRLVCQVTSWGYGEAWVPDEDAGVLRRATFHVDDERFRPFVGDGEPITLASEEGLPGRVWASGEGDWVADAAEADPAEFPRYTLAESSGVRAALAVPLTAEGRVIAVLMFLTDETRERDEKLIETVGGLASHLGALLVRQRLERAVVDERELLDRILDVSPVGILVFDADGAVSRANQAAVDRLGIPKGELSSIERSSPVWDLRTPAGDEIPDGEGPVAQAFATGEPQLDYHIDLRTPAGNRIDAVVNAAPITDSEGTVRKVVVVLEDETDEVRYRQGLEAKNRELESFASVLSHDLRNPLAVMKGYLELARETGELTYLEPAERATDRMEALINDLLLLARRGRAIGAKTTVDIGTVSRAAWAAVDTAEATLTVGEDLGTLQADESRLQQLFENLFRNAVEHAGRGCRVAVVALPDAAGFAVEDDGPGIPSDRRGEVVELGAHTEGGVRLGLSIVAAIAEAHGWELRITDAANGGARFEFDTTGALGAENPPAGDDG